MSDINEVKQNDNQDNIINIDRENLQSEPPLSPSEEEKYKQIQEDKAIVKLTEFRDRVFAIKAAIETDSFMDIFIKPIRGNIATIKEELETVEKPRELAVKQGQLHAYRKMLNFPNTACEQLNTEVLNIKRDLPLFYINDPLVKECQQIKFDEDSYRIVVPEVSR